MNGVCLASGPDGGPGTSLALLPESCTSSLSVRKQQNRTLVPLFSNNDASSHHLSKLLISHIFSNRRGRRGDTLRGSPSHPVTFCSRMEQGVPERDRRASMAHALVGKVGMEASHFASAAPFRYSWAPPFSPGVPLSTRSRSLHRAERGVLRAPRPALAKGRKPALSAEQRRSQTFFEKT